MDTRLLWSAHHPDGSVAAAALVVPSPGRTASVLFSSAETPESIECVGRLLDLAAQELAAEGELALLQCLPKPAEQSRARALQHGGFKRLAQLDYMERANSAPAPDRAATLPLGWSLHPWERLDTDMLSALLQRTFEGTLDCPGLAQMRQGHDILDGHLHAGDGDTSHWRILKRADEPVGAMLLSPCLATSSVDIIYLGLVPSARGRGAGTALLSHGLREAARIKARTVQVAVDTANAPAVAIYRRAGFATKQQREAWVRPLSSGDTCPQRMDTCD